MGEYIGTEQIFAMTQNREDNSILFEAGPKWNALLNAVRRNEGKLSTLGATVGALAGVAMHSGMVETSARAFVRAAEPPMSQAEEKIFMAGAMTQQPVMLDLDRARGGQL